MKRKLKVCCAALMCLALACAAASAETISFSGTVCPKETHEVYAPIGGTVESVDVALGQAVKAEDAIATLKTTKVYADRAGTVTGVFGQAGDSAETVAARWGGVVYIEGETRCTIAATTATAFNAVENKFIHAGEEVHLVARSDTGRRGSGVVTAVSGTNYTVEVTSGDFAPGESCDIYRGEAMVASGRIGRGSVSRVDPVAVTGTGSIVSYAVESGDRVERGQLLFETLDGAFDGLNASGTQLRAGVDGVVGQLGAAEGSALEKGGVAAVIYPDGSMRLEAAVNEADLGYLAVGDPVDIEWLWNADGEATVNGTVAMISAVANADAEDVTYNVYIDFTPTEDTRYGMSAVISTREREADADARP